MRKVTASILVKFDYYVKKTIMKIILFPSYSLSKRARIADARRERTRNSSDSRFGSLPI